MAHPPVEKLAWHQMSVRDILELAIADEEEARDYYRRAAEMTGNFHTRRVLLDLSSMEQSHAEILRKELNEQQLQRELESGIAD